MMLVFMLLAIGVSPSLTLIAYDCTDPGTNITQIGIDKVESCSTEFERTEIVTQYVQILKEQELSTINYVECQILKSTLITHCGMHSHASMLSKSISIMEPVDIRSSECTEMYHTKMYVTAYHHKILNLKINGSTYVSLTELGVVDSSGKCHGTSFTLDGTTYVDAIMNTHYSININQKNAIFHHSSTTMKFYDGTVCLYRSGHCQLSNSALASWIVTPQRSTCGSTIYNLLYEGSANITSSSTSLKVLVVENQHQKFAMALKDQAILCGHHGYKTGDDSIIVITGIPGSLPSHPEPGQLDINAFHNMDLKLIYLERNIVNRTTDMYKAFSKRYCDLTKNYLHSLISLARQNPEEFAWAYVQKPGYTAVLRGEVIYLIECIPVKVKVFQTHQCYQELPVKTSENKTRYVKPSTRILVDIGTELECSALLPPLYNIDGTWIRLGQDITIPLAPHRLSIVQTNPWKYGNLVTIGTLGMLTDQQINQYRTAIISPLEQHSIISGFSKRIGDSIGYTGAIVDYSSAIDTEKLSDQISSSILYKMYGWWQFIIQHLAGLLGFMILWNIITSVLSCLMNLFLLYKRYGFSSILLFSVWSAMSKHILYGNVVDKIRNRYKKVKITNQQQGDIEDITNKDTEKSEELTSILTELYPKLHAEGIDAKYSASAPRHN